MTDDTKHTVKEFAEMFEMPTSTVYGLIKRNKVTSIKENGHLYIIRDDLFSSFITSHIEQKYSTIEPFTPEELSEYHIWHQIVDYFAWLLKICYSSKDEVKRKKFNIRTIFENYLNQNKIDIQRISKNYKGDLSKKHTIINDLKRGWYNELSFIYPLKPSTLGLSYQDIEINKHTVSSRFLFPSWKITQCYYSTFFYLRSITLVKNPNVRIEEHKAILNSFKNSALPNFKNTVWKFPFDIQYKVGDRFYIKNTLISKIKHLSYTYSNHPREPKLNATEITKFLHNYFKKRGKRFGKKAHYTLFDFLLEFRIWANYLDIDNLLSLYGEGYKTYLDQNLSLILFVIGGISELTFISLFGEDIYIEELQNIYDVFAKNNDEMKDNFIYSSIYQRMKIYKIRNLINSEIKIDSIINNNEIK